MASDAAQSCERPDGKCPHPAMCEQYGCAQERARLSAASASELQTLLSGDDLRAKPSYMLTPVIVAAAKVASLGNLIDSCDPTEQVDRFALEQLRGALVGIGYARKDVEGR